MAADWSFNEGRTHFAAKSVPQQRDHDCPQFLESELLNARPLAFREDVLQRPDVELHYKTVGEGPTMLFLSGGPGFSCDYLCPVAEHFAPRFLCVLLDQRGTGRSRLPAIDADTMSIQEHIQDVEALRVDLESGPAVIFAHSFGGSLALQYAISYPRSIRCLVLVGSGGTNLAFMKACNDAAEMRRSDQDRQVREHWSKPEIAQADSVRATWETTRIGLRGMFTRPEAADAYASELTRTDHFFDPEVTRSVLEASSSWDITARAGALRVATLLVYGRDDPMGAEDLPRRLTEIIPGSRLSWIANAGHIPWYEQPKAFYDAVDRFIHNAA